MEFRPLVSVVQYIKAVSLGARQLNPYHSYKLKRSTYEMRLYDLIAFLKPLVIPLMEPLIIGLVKRLIKLLSSPSFAQHLRLFNGFSTF
jgi:hypothetical protein